MYKIFFSVEFYMKVTDADRQTTPQPMTVGNLRKLECITYHLSQIGDLITLERAKAEVLCNFQFLSSKLAAVGAEKVHLFFIIYF